MDSDFLGELLEGVFSLESVKLNRGVNVKELINGKVSSSYSDDDLALFDSHVDLSGSEEVDSLALSHEHDLEFRSVRVVIDVFSKSLVNIILSDRDVHGHSGLELNNVFFKSINLALSILKLSEEFERGIVSLVDLLLKVEHEVSCLVELLSNAVLLSSDLLDD